MSSRLFSFFENLALGKALLLVLVLTTLYSASGLAWYGQTPLGRVPLLDGVELSMMAQALAEGTHEAEPFYRAPLYPALLALPLALGMPESALPDFARVLNFITHLISTACVFGLVWRFWHITGAAFLCALFWGVYPVSLFFAGDILDITLAIALAMTGLWFVLGGERIHWKKCLVGGLLLGLAVITRPQFLALAVGLGIGLLFVNRLQAVALAGGLVSVLLTLGGINVARSGEFAMLPTQGAFNLWAANKPGTNGLYFAQTVGFEDLELGKNPAREESIYLYQEATGDSTPTLEEANAYWRAKTTGMLWGENSDPVGLLKRIGGKILALLNGFEQYNNKTYAAHQALNPWLWTPILWPLVLLVGLLGLAGGWGNVRLRLLVFAALCYALGLLLTFVSARFRLPLVPLLVVCAGGITQLQPSRAGKFAGPVLVVILVVFFVSLWPFGHLWSKYTYAEDYTLISEANMKQGYDRESYEFAEMALAIRPGHTRARELETLGCYNLMLAGEWEMPGRAQAQAWLEEPYFVDTGDTRFANSVMLWRAGRYDEALAVWRGDALGNPQQGLAALILTGEARQADRARLDVAPDEAVDPYLYFALIATGSQAPSNEDELTQAKLLQALLPPRP